MVAHDSSDDATAGVITLAAETRFTNSDLPVVYNQHGSNYTAY